MSPQKFCSFCLFRHEKKWRLFYSLTSKTIWLSKSIFSKTTFVTQNKPSFNCEKWWLAFSYLMQSCPVELTLDSSPKQFPHPVLSLPQVSFSVPECRLRLIVVRGIHCVQQAPKKNQIQQNFPHHF